MPKNSQKIRNIGFIGNFRPPFSTENDRKWSFEKLGHKVVTYQEDQTTVEQLMEALEAGEFEILFYSHTHGWDIPGLKDFFAVCQKSGVPTVSVHLDRWAGLDRVKDVGQEATWFTEYIFMADASPEAVALYEEHKLNWYWLKPGVVERDCFMAAPDPAIYPYDIVFVGSKNYHPEYPFRRELLDFLQGEYGHRFGHFGGDGRGVVRGNELNQLMASAKIVVGDTCFSGTPRYVSDRYYETRGRGGFLLHPHIEGIDTVGVGHFAIQKIDDLKAMIDYWLQHDEEREAMREKGFNYVKDHETYTHRAQEMLEVIYDN